MDQVPRDVLRGGLTAMISFQVLEIQLCLLLGQVLSKRNCRTRYFGEHSLIPVTLLAIWTKL